MSLAIVVWPLANIAFQCLSSMEKQNLHDICMKMKETYIGGTKVINTLPYVYQYCKEW